LTAANGEEALDLIGGRECKIDGMVTDIMMPAMDGMALIRAVRSVMPELKIIASTGLGSDMGGTTRTQELKSMGVSHFLPKPYSTDKLLNMLNQLLNASNTNSALRQAV
jgi:two-component system, cell cycle sensor histidine kinase and response regulator CckA